MGRTKRKRKTKQKTSDLNFSVKTTRPDPDSRIIELLKWLGIKTQLHHYHFPNAGRGLRTSKLIRANDYLISVPMTKMITRFTIQENYPPHWSTHLMLSCFILDYQNNDEKNNSTLDWSFYMKTLPQTYDVPYFDVSSNELIQVLPLYLKNQIQNQFKLIQKQYEQAKNFVKTDLNTFAWAWFSVNTRGVYFPDGHDNLALAPYLDMFNHCPDVEVKIEIIDGHYHIKSLQDWQKYDQVFINYGPHENTKLYVEYGFVLRDHPYDCLPITLQDITKVTTFKKKIRENKIEFIKQHKLDQNLKIFNTEEIVSWSVLACLNVLLDENESKISVFETDLQPKNFIDEIETIIVNQSNQIQRAQQLCLKGVSATPLDDVSVVTHPADDVIKGVNCQQPSVLPVLLDVYDRLCEQSLKHLKSTMTRY